MESCDVKVFAELCCLVNTLWVTFLTYIQNNFIIEWLPQTVASEKPFHLDSIKRIYSTYVKVVPQIFHFKFSVLTNSLHIMLLRLFIS